NEISELLNTNKIKHTKAVFYLTVSSDLTDMEIGDYDLLVFYSPSGIASLYNNFQSYVQNNTKIATFGPTTAKAAIKAGLRIDLKVPSPEFPSMTMALDYFINEENKRNGK
ncbi:MAG: uroporphyrinogen-III synthase, partial [Bacteroidales bacterium]|nr:uroporphyrinogen-III synthase [Bacteroidales bacterium]